MAFTYVERVQAGNNTASTTLSLTGVNAVVGETLVLNLALNTSASVSISDPGNNVWTVRATANNSGNYVYIFQCPVVTGFTSGTVTLTFGASTKSFGNISRWQGLGDFYTNNFATANSSTSLQYNTSITPAQIGTSVAMAVSSSGAGSPTSGSATTLGGSSDGANFGVRGCFVTYTGTDTFTQFTFSGNTSNWAAVTVDINEGWINLLRNPGFETDSNADGVADYWVLNSNTAVAPTVTRPTDPQSGTYSQRMQYTGQAGDNGTKFASLYQTCSPGGLIPGHRYRFTVWIKGSVSNANLIMATDVKDASNNTLITFSRSVTPTAGWNQYHLSFVAPVNSSYALPYVYISNVASNTSADWYMDSAVLTEEPVVADGPAYFNRPTSAPNTVFLSPRSYSYYEVVVNPRTGSYPVSYTTIARNFVAPDTYATMSRTVETMPNNMYMDTFSYETVPNYMNSSATNVITGTTTGVYVSLDSQWNLTVPISNSASTAWNVLSRVNASNFDSQWNVYALSFTQVDASPIMSNWNVNAIISTSSVSSTWNINNIISATSTQVTWNIIAIANSTLDAQWNVTGGVSTSQDILWNVNNMVSASSVTSTWNVNNMVSATGSSVAWNVLGIGNSSIDSNWNINSTVSLSRDSNWSIGSIVSRNSDYNWNINTIVSTSGTDMAWNVLIMLSLSGNYIWNDLSTLDAFATVSQWNISALASKNLGTQWLVLAGVDKTQDVWWETLSNTAEVGWATQWNTLAVASLSQNFLWCDLTMLSKSNDGNWNINTIASLSKDIVWNAQVSVEVSQDAQWDDLSILNLNQINLWNVLGVTSATQDSNWNVCNMISTNRDINWNINQIVNKLQDYSWSLSAIVAVNQGSQWYVLGIINTAQDYNWNDTTQVAFNTNSQWMTLIRVNSNQIISDWNLILLPPPYIHLGTLSVINGEAGVDIINGVEDLDILDSVADLDTV